MKYCHACGMPLEKKEDFAKGDADSDFCRYCTNEDGTVKSCEKVFIGGVEFFVQTLGGNRDLAERVTRKNMLQLPYWKGKDCLCLTGDVATDEEFQEVLAKMG
jgi:hypothetical protein